MFVSREQNSGKNQDLKTANKLFETIEIQILGNDTIKLKFHAQII